jgi:MFS family permease
LEKVPDVMVDPKQARPDATFWKIAGAGASFQAGSTAIDSATIVASLVYHLTGSTLAVGYASTVLRLGWLLPQLFVGFLAERTDRRMPLYATGAFGRAGCLILIACVLGLFGSSDAAWTGVAFLVAWTFYAFVSGIVAVPYNDIVGRSITSALRSRMLAWRFFGGGILALFLAAVIHRLMAAESFHIAYSVVFAIAGSFMVVSSIAFVSAGEPPVKALSRREKKTLRRFVAEGREVFWSDLRFRRFLYSQWLGGAALMVLPFYVVAASGLGLKIEEIALLLGAQTFGALASNPFWGRIGDGMGKIYLLRVVGMLRLGPPVAIVMILNFGSAYSDSLLLGGFVVIFTTLGALMNGTTIGYLGYLMEISPDDRRPAYSAYFNVFAAPAAFLPLIGGLALTTVSLTGLFVLAMAVALAQFLVLMWLPKDEEKNPLDEPGR